MLWLNCFFSSPGTRDSTYRSSKKNGSKPRVAFTQHVTGERGGVVLVRNRRRGGKLDKVGRRQRQCGKLAIRGPLLGAAALPSGGYYASFAAAPLTVVILGLLERVPASRGRAATQIFPRHRFGNHKTKRTV